ncbi:hypothetical protein MQM1_06 [Aeromonas phage vB_AsaP_MQM1]|nr:hypothetical protein MQM1_06 [Aeromonas phage vB_AsaP_MQM1]
MSDLMNKEQRLASEAAQLATAEAAFAAEFGSQPEQTQAPATQTQAPDASQRQPDEGQVNWEKRYKDLQSHADKQRVDAEKQLKALQSQMEAHGIQPEAGDEMAQLRDQIKQLEDFKHSTEVSTAVRKAQESVAQVHPDFEEVITDTIFEEWIAAQPEVFKKAIYDDVPDAALAAKALTLFKAETGLVGESVAKSTLRQEQELAAQGVKAGGREVPQTQQQKVWTYAEIQRMKPHEYASHAAEIDKAYAEGRIR